MSNPQNLPPELLKRIQNQIAKGGPLPPGVVAVPGGQSPPPGAVPTGITAPQVPGALHQPGTPQEQKAQARQEQNPIPEGDAGLQLLRNLSDCPIPEESGKLQQMMKGIMSSKDMDDDVVEQSLVRGIVVSLRANKHCGNQLRKRTVCIFDQDDTLAKLHETIKTETEELERLNKEIQACVERGNKALNARWNRAVKTYGLAPEKFSYQINEEDGIIELVELKCLECKGATAIRKARQETAEILLRMEAPKKEEKDDKSREGQGTDASEGNSREDGKASTEE